MVLLCGVKVRCPTAQVMSLAEPGVHVPARVHTVAASGTVLFWEMQLVCVYPGVQPAGKLFAGFAGSTYVQIVTGETCPSEGLLA